MNTVSCMGGWGCPKRETCALHVRDNRTAPVERLCAKGQTDSYEPVSKTVVQWTPVRRSEVMNESA